ncbi:MAG: putative DNA mismatch repair protein Msh6 [Streblomastix strix]|uniref:Putative DNA mismatch repair protein Msh6 n=1 Tax=Streblomastix strix TaxID=222440 RepID=A0A5J4WYP9_9EUKA|nr:MAG: putative DNA mismatch repair protein Msh6 [Streblomastix strix]
MIMRLQTAVKSMREDIRRDREQKNIFDFDNRSNNYNISSPLENIDDSESEDNQADEDEQQENIITDLKNRTRFKRPTTYINPQDLPSPANDEVQAFTSITSHGGGLRLSDFLSLLHHLRIMTLFISSKRIKHWIGDSDYNQERNTLQYDEDVLQAKRLKQLLTIEGRKSSEGKQTSGLFPNIDSILSFFELAFNRSGGNQNQSQSSLLAKTMLFSRRGQDGKRARRTFTGQSSSAIATPAKGVDKIYDRTCDEMQSICKGLEDHIEEVRLMMKKKIKEMDDNKQQIKPTFGSVLKINLKSIGNDPLQLEIPLELVQFIPKDWDMISSTKDSQRFWTPKIKVAIPRLSELNIRREARCRHFAARVQILFAHYSTLWLRASAVFAELDSIRSLAHASRAICGCRPRLVSKIPMEQMNKLIKKELENEQFESEQKLVGGAVFEAKELRHPCFQSGISRNVYISALNEGLIKREQKRKETTRKFALNTSNAKDTEEKSVLQYTSPDTFIPNDVQLGGLHPPVLILTGPNMGGKSVFLKMTALCCLLAQCGCFVPAQSCAFTPCDRIFVRAGAGDRILLGQSTLFVEMLETATTLHYATSMSLVILDELGRGTATHDGHAIASAVLQDLTHRVACRTLVATHHHALAVEMARNGGIQLGHMLCKTKQTNESQNDITLKSNLNQQVAQRPIDVVFLYRCISGVCPRSFGMNVARLAGLPLSVVDRANNLSQQMESADELNYFTQTKNQNDKSQNRVVSYRQNLQHSFLSQFAGSSSNSAVALSIYSRMKNLGRKIKILQEMGKLQTKKDNEQEQFREVELIVCTTELKELVLQAKELQSGVLEE